MSGIEVAGIVLAVIPLLVQGLANYKSGLKDVGRGFRKRQTVDKLCRALRLQSSTLEELVKHVLLSSGCEAPTHLDTHSLGDPDFELDVAEYLGQRCDMFTSMMDECDEILQGLVAKVATFIPAQKSGELQTIIEANRNTPKGQLSLLSRVNLILSMKSLEEDCRKLDESVAAMDRFLSRLTSNHQLSALQPSGRSKRMARVFRSLRTHASNLYTAISKGWEPDCHEKHEVKLRLQDRQGELKQRHKGEAIQTSVHIFELVFVGDLSSQHRLWHETTVHVLKPSANDQDDDDDHSTAHTAQREPVKVKVAIREPSNGPNVPKSQPTQDIRGICSAIQEAHASQESLLFMLTPRHRFARPTERKKWLASSRHQRTVQLSNILDTKSGDAHARALSSWKAKVNLALLVASNFLQLLETPWIQLKLSCHAVSFLQQDEADQIDLSRPFICHAFGPGSSPPASNTKAPVSDALVELGIMLLEIWHATTLRQTFGLDVEPERRERQMKALEWYEAVDTQLPGRYCQAIFHCISGIRGAIPGELRSDDMRLWESLCEKVVQPLRVISDT